MKTFDVLKADQKTMRKVLQLLRDDHVFLSNYNADKDAHDNGIYPAINCTNVFSQGADVEPLREVDLDVFAAVVKLWPLAGDIAWVSFCRGGLNPAESGWDEWDAQCAEAIAGIPEVLREFRDKRTRGPLIHAKVQIVKKALIQYNGDGTWVGQVNALSTRTFSGATQEELLANMVDGLSDKGAE